MKGSIWTILGFATNRLLLLISTAILAHWLAPSQFGLLAIATTVTTAVLIFSDLGLAGSLITHKAPTKDTAGIIFGCYIVTAPLLATVVFAIGVLCLFVANPDDAHVLMAVAGVLFISGPSWFLTSYLRKELLFFRQFLATSIQAAVQFGATLLFAVLGYGVWSILIGQAVGVVAYTIIQLTSLTVIPRPLFRLSYAIAAVREGRGFFLQSFFAFISQNIDNAAALILTGNTGLGLYAMSYRLAEIPYVAVVQPVSDVTFVRFAQLNNSGEDVSRPFLRSHRLLSLVTTPLSCVFITSASSLLMVLYGPSWHAAVVPFTILGVWSLIRGPQTGLGWLLNSMGRAREMGTFSGLIMIVTVPLILASGWLWHLPGIASVMLLEVAVSYLYMLRLVRTRLEWPIRPIVTVLFHNCLTVVLSWGLLSLIELGVGSAPAVVRLALGIGSAVVAQLVVAGLFQRELLTEIVQRGADLLHRDSRQGALL
jgi:O-antigen/teichoic acid export membrane protein